MPSQELVAAYRSSRQRHDGATEELAALLERMAVETLVEVLPGAHRIEAVGQLNEDWIPTLRIQRVRDAAGAMLFDVDTGHRDRAVEDAVDLVNVEYLDVLIDVTGDRHMGETTIG